MRKVRYIILKIVSKLSTTTYTCHNMNVLTLHSIYIIHNTTANTPFHFSLLGKCVFSCYSSMCLKICVLSCFVFMIMFRFYFIFPHCSLHINYYRVTTIIVHKCSHLISIILALENQ